ncbi:hypothetical protein HME9304_00197 [Flagellimonas maritima]|uniref:DUF748 domain-containing protein n=1 Tax=Flagellimonas maritima TaxID=1383885 RepID=A0A2Z4LN77_9FLAO|nr:hypothetical protein HME9304_00197 [Allomuricauda aurantiaca]
MRKKLFITVITVAVLFLTVKLLVPIFIKNHLNKTLKTIPECTGTVDDVSISFFGSTLFISGIVLNYETQAVNIDIDIKDLELSTMGLIDVARKKTPSFSKIKVDDYVLNITKRVVDTTLQGDKAKKKSSFYIDKFESFNGRVIYNDATTKKQDVILEAPLFSIKNIDYSDGKLSFFDTEKQELNLELDKVNLALGDYEKLSLAKLSFKNSNAKIDGFAIETIYDISQLSKIRSTERDHYKFSVDLLSLNQLNFSKENGDSLYIKGTNILMDSLNLEIYRDKTLADDLTVKKYYGEMLRSIPAKMKIDSILIANSSIVYTEKISNDLRAENIYFNNIEGKITDLSSYIDKDINLELKGLLMGEAPVDINYSVNPTDTDENFLVSGSMHNLDTEAINPFLKISMKAVAEGKVDRTYFTFGGNAYAASGDIKMEYENLHFKFLDKDLLKIKKVVSFVVNLFVNDGSKSNSRGFRFGTIDTEPDKTKSFTNYVWVCIRDGILDTITGNGKKD